MRTASDPHYLEVIARFRSARKNLGISQIEVGRRLGKPQSYISKIESCERRIDLIEALRLCDVLGISLETIVPVELKDLFQKNPKAK